MTKILSLILLMWISLFAIDFDGVKFKRKLSKPLPEWMTNQIEQELRPFREKGVTKQDLIKTVEEVQSLPGGYNAQLVHYKIKNNKMSWSSKNKLSGDARIDHLIDFINTVAQYVKFPDIELVASLWDCYDNPLFLEHSYCPVFTICKQRQNQQAVLWPETVYIGFKTNVLKAVLEASEKSPWKKKKDRVYWRGNTTNGYYSPHNWDNKPRPKLIFFSEKHPKLIDAKFIGTYWSDPSVAKWIESNGYVTKWSYPPAHVDYKYQIAIDGNSFASSFYWQLISNCVILKSRSNHIEWFYRGLRDGVHYVSFDSDCHDLKKAIMTLRSDQQRAQRIASAATTFAKETLMMEDIACYFYHLFHTYAKLLK